MNAATIDGRDVRWSSPLTDPDDFVARADRAVREGARYVPPARSSDEDIEAALRAEGLLESDREQIRRHFRDPEGHYRWGENGWMRVDCRDPEAEILPKNYEVVHPTKVWFAVSSVHLDRMREFVGHQGFVAYWPRQVRLRIRGRGNRRKRVAVATPLFQRYVLVHLPGRGTLLPEIMSRGEWLEQLRGSSVETMVRGFRQSAAERIAWIEERLARDSRNSARVPCIGQPYYAPFGRLTTHEARFNGVGEFLSNAAGPIAIPDFMVDGIVKRERDGEFDATSRKGKRRVSKLPEWCFLGNIVRVAQGPFASFPGVIEEIDEVRERLKVAVMIFGRATPVDLGVDQVEPL